MGSVGLWGSWYFHEGRILGILSFQKRFSHKYCLFVSKDCRFDPILKILSMKKLKTASCAESASYSCIIQAIGLDKPGVVLRWFGCRIGTCSRSSPVRPVFSHSPWDWWTHTCGIWNLRLCDNSVDIHLAFLLLADRDGRISFAISEIKKRRLLYAKKAWL